MQLKDLHKFLALNTDDEPGSLQPGEVTDALNVRMGSSSEAHGSGLLETLQGEVSLLINPDASQIYYGQSIGGQFVYDGYAEALIGTQVWMKKNWDGNYPGSKSYDDDTLNIDIYGRLYTHNMAMASDFCPDGWHVPTEADIDTLLTFLGGAMIAGGKLKEVGESHWLDSNTGAADSYAFRALPGGMFDTLFSLLGSKGMFWLQDEAAPNAPIATAATSVETTSFTSNWLPSDGADGYYLDVSTAIDFSSFVGTYHDLDVGNVIDALVTGLSANTTYYYRLRAYNEIGTSDYSNIITVATEGLPNVYGALYNWYAVAGIANIPINDDEMKNPVIIQTLAAGTTTDVTTTILTKPYNTQILDPTGGVSARVIESTVTIDYVLTGGVYHVIIYNGGDAITDAEIYILY